MFHALKAAFPARRGIESLGVSGKTFDRLPELHALPGASVAPEQCSYSSALLPKEWPGKTVMVSTSTAGAWTQVRGYATEGQPRGSDASSGDNEHCYRQGCNHGHLWRVSVQGDLMTQNIGRNGL